MGLLSLVTNAFPVFAIDAPKSSPQSVPADGVVSSIVPKLTYPFRIAVADQPLRAALNSIANASKCNYWLDRNIDPTVLVRSDDEGKQAATALQAFKNVAASAHCHVAVVGNMVLIGRTDWVEKIGATLLAFPSSEIRDISWATATTPTAAMNAIGLPPSQPLPHDLWPAVSWSGVSPATAHRLIVAQFDLMPGGANSDANSDAYQTLQAPATVTAMYPAGPGAKELREALVKSDPKASIKSMPSGLVVRAKPAAHIAATLDWLESSSVAVAKPLDIKNTRFTLRVENTPAANVFGQLAATAGRTLVIAPLCGVICEKPISFSVQDESMAGLTQRIADDLGLKLTWTETQLLIEAQ